MPAAAEAAAEVAAAVAAAEVAAAEVAAEVAAAEVATLRSVAAAVEAATLRAPCRWSSSSWSNCSSRSGSLASLGPVGSAAARQDPIAASLDRSEALALVALAQLVLPARPLRAGSAESAARQ